jgi:hypothetical protein
MPSKNTARWGRRQSRQASGGADGFAVFGQFGNLGAKKAPTGAEQPFGTIVDGHAPGEAPQPLTLNHPASNPGCSQAVGVHSFEGTTAVVDLRQAKNEFNRPPPSGLRTCTIRDEDLMVPVVGDEGSSSVCSKGPSQLAASFSFDTSIRTDRRMTPNFAHRRQSMRSACFAPSGRRYQAFQRPIM